MAGCSVSFAKHTLECSVIVVGVRGKLLVGEERRRVQELRVGLDGSLLGVEAVGFITCGEVELVRQVHTLFVRSAKQVVVFELQVREEVEGVLQEVREVKGESKVEERRSLQEHVDDMDDKYKTHDLSHGECARDVTKCADKQDKQKQDNARSRSDIVEVSEKWSCRHWCPHHAVSPRNHVQL